MQVLIVEDDPPFAGRFVALFNSLYGDRKVTIVNDLAGAKDAIQRSVPDLIILDAIFPTETSVYRPVFNADKLLNILEQIIRSKRINENFDGEPPDIIIVSSKDEVANQFDRVEGWIKAGKIHEVMSKPAGDNGWRLFAEILKHKADAIRQDRTLRLPIRGGSAYLRRYDIYTKSEAMTKVGDKIRRFGPANETVLITGETGTGKDLIALALHNASERKDMPFITIVPSNWAKEMASSQLFGHKKGSFTDGKTDYLGSIRAADGGTIFIDEIGDIPPEIQVFFLRLLQNKEVSPLGYPAPVKVNVRFIAATNKNLERLVEEGEFREDLFYRLTVLQIHVPPLRDRPEDIDLLLKYFLDKKGAKAINFAPEVLRFFNNYGWSGNVRELEATAATIYIESNNGDLITLERMQEIAPRLFTQLRAKDTVRAITPPLTKMNPSEKAEPPQSLMARLRAEIDRLAQLRMEGVEWDALKKDDYANKEFPAWRELGSNKPVILAILKDVFKDTKIDVAAFSNKLEKPEHTNPGSLLVYKVLLYLVSQPDHKARINEIEALPNIAWETAKIIFSYLDSNLPFTSYRTKPKHQLELLPAALAKKQRLENEGDEHAAQDLAAQED